ncbi:calcium calmodulin-dependent protein kinase type 1G [Entophlyctis luteolus]|nr:calcium calmodulin-dependent protein kinase type 1G [Entophlyctis luteolus]
MANINTLDFLLGKYELGQTLGTGAFSEVKAATERSTGNKFAIKIIDKTKCKGKETMIETEVKILMRVRHENIVRLFEIHGIVSGIVFFTPIHQSDRVTGGELFDDIVGRGKYSETETGKIVYRILLAINYLHSHGIVHRDLKVDVTIKQKNPDYLNQPENLLLSDKTPNAKIMISDFGLSKIFCEEEVMKTACGTPGYVAPEVLKRQGYGREVDLWSLGVITYILLCGYPPFYDSNNVELFKQIMTGRYEFDKPWWDDISDNAKDFIKKLLVLDPYRRMTAHNALHHPFIHQALGTRSELNRVTTEKFSPEPNSMLHLEQNNVATIPEYFMPQFRLPKQEQHQYPVGSQRHSCIHGHQNIQQNLAHTSQENYDCISVASEKLTQQCHRTHTIQPGRPLGTKTHMDDSACATSNEGLANVAQPVSGSLKWAWKKWTW